MKRAEYDKKYREENKEEYALRQKKKRLKARYNLTFDDYLQMCSEQNNVCAICKKQETTKTSHGDIRPLAVDHCHTSNKVRGLLCNKCNIILGFCEDNPLVLLEAAEYLKRHES